MAVLQRHKSTVYGLVTDLAQLQTNIDNEASARESGDNALQVNIDAEAARALAAEQANAAAISAEETRATGAESALGGRIDDVNTAAGISGDSYSAPAGTNYLGSATSLVNADVKLDAAIKTASDAVATEASARAAADTTLQNNIDAEASARSTADSALSGRLDVVEGTGEGSVAKAESDAKAYADSILAAFEAGDFQTLEDLVAVINSDSTVEGSFRKAIADVVASAPEALDTLNEIASYIAVDGTGDDVLSAIVNSVTAAKAEIRGEVSEAYDTLAEVEDALDIINGSGEGSIAKAAADAAAAVSAEETARIAGDAALQTQIDANATSAANATADVASDLAAEVARATAAEAANATAISDEATARAAADTTLQGNIDAEETARIAGDSALDAKVADLSGVTDAAAARGNLDVYNTGEVDSLIASGGAVFTTEILTVAGDSITLTHEPKNGVIFNFGTVRHTDANFVSYDIPATVGASAKIFNLAPNASGDFDGKAVVVQYAYTPSV